MRPGSARRRRAVRRRPRCGGGRAVTRRDELGGEERTNAGLVKELRSEGLDELLDLTGELALLGCELLDAARDRLEREQRTAELGVRPAIGPSGGQAREQTSRTERSQFAAERLRGGDE